MSGPGGAPGQDDPGPQAPRPVPAVPPPAERAPDDSDVGWGERMDGGDESERRYLEDRPPHWGSD